MRLGAEEFRVVTGGAHGMADRKWLRDHLPGDGSAQLADLTSAWCTLGLWGPRSRDILASVTSDDVSHEGFPFATCRTIDVDTLRVLANRISYVGDLGWELYVPIEQGARLWDILWEAGRAHGAVPAGIGVYGTTGRLEKCYRAYGAELESEFTVVEAGMTGPKVKEQDFVGKEAHLRHREEEPAAVLCTLTVDDHNSANGREALPAGTRARRLARRCAAGRREGPPFVRDQRGRRPVDRQAHPHGVSAARAGERRSRARGRVPGRAVSGHGRRRRSDADLRSRELADPLVNVLACVKRVPLTGGTIVLTEDAQAIATQHLGFTISPHEECGVEEAVRLVEAHGGESVVLTLGPAEAEEQLRDAMALGVDRAIHLVTGGEEWDPQATAAAIVEAIEAERAAGVDFDLIFFGNESADSGGYQVGIRVAHALGLPVATGLKGVVVEGAARPMRAGGPRRQGRLRAPVARSRHRQGGLELPALSVRPGAHAGAEEARRGTVPRRRSRHGSRSSGSSCRRARRRRRRSWATVRTRRPASSRCSSGSASR